MPNINDFDRLYRRIKTGVGVDGEVVRICLESVQPDTLRVLTHVTVENKTNGCDICRLGLTSTGRDHYLDEITSLIEAELAVSRSDILLWEREVFFAEFTGADGGDELLLTCVGWEQNLK